MAFYRERGSYCLRKLCRITNVGASHVDQIVGRAVLDFIHPEDRIAIKNRIQSKYEGQRLGQWMEQRAVRLDGGVVDVEVIAVPFVHLGCLTSQVIVRDITDRKRAEQEKLDMERRLPHAQKLESLGILAGGIAHDFNNILAGIMGYADLVKLQLPASEPARKDIDIIKKAVERAAHGLRHGRANAGEDIRSFLHDEVHGSGIGLGRSPRYFTRA